MAVSNEERGATVVLEEEKEGNREESADYYFDKVGEPVPLKPHDSVFDLESLPAQPLAVSEQFSAIFVAHPEGFCVARTKDVIELAKDIKNKGSSSCIQELSIVDVPLGKVYILALSMDSSTLAAAVGGDVHFFLVDSLLKKEKNPSFHCSLTDSCHVKDLRWRKKLENSYVVLSNHGILYQGVVGSPLKDVMDNVDAVEWSFKGNFVAIAKKNILSILSSKFEELFHISLLFKSWIGDADPKYTIKVDCIKWVRHDCIILGCFQLTEDGKEEGYLVQVIISRNGKIVDAASEKVVLSFDDLFEGFVDDIVPYGGGPYLFFSYLEKWGFALTANRKNTDRHIVLMSWLLDDEQKEASVIDITRDNLLPRIELQENGDDNLILGFGVDKVSLYEKVKVMVGDGERIELSPYCVLLCLTLEGKLVMFHVAGATETTVAPPISSAFTDEEDDSSTILPVGYDSSKTSAAEQHKVEGALLNSKSKETTQGAIIKNHSDIVKFPERNSPGQELKVPENLQNSDRDRQHNEYSVKQNLDNSQLQISWQRSSTLDQVPVKPPPVLGFGSAFRDPSKMEGQTLVSAPLTGVKNTDSLTGMTQSDTSSIGQLCYKDPLESAEVGKEIPKMVGSANIQSASSESWSRGKLLFSNDPTAKLSSFASSPVQGNRYEKSGASTGATRFAGSHSFSSDLSGGSIFNSRDSSAGASLSVYSSGKATQIGGQKAFTGTGNVESKPTIRSSPISSQENSDLSGGSISNSRDSSAAASLSVFESGKATQTGGQKAFTGTGSVESKPTIRSSPISSQENSVLGRSLNYKLHPTKENFRTTQPSGVLDSDPELSKHFGSVKEMVKELDTLLSHIEEDGGFRDACTISQKDSIMSLEEGIDNLSDRCRVWRNTLDEQLNEVQQLLDKTAQVLVRKVYIEGIVKQASDSQYWDLWNRQKLSPELDLKRRQILEVNKNLTSQLIELERHFNNLELNKFGEDGGVPFGHKAFHGSFGTSRHTQPLHSLYNTMNSQLAAAEQLSECLSKQMALLNIESPSVKRKNVAKELFESIGLSYNGDCFNSPDVKGSGHTPNPVKRLAFSSQSTATKDQSRNPASAMKNQEPETARRRRDSLDRSWASFEPPKTTIKRMVLQDERPRVTGIKPPLVKTKEIFSARVWEGPSTTLSKDHRASSPSLQTTIKKNEPQRYGGSKDMQDRPSKQAFENQPTSLFKWANDHSGPSESLGLKAPTMQVTQQSNPLPSSSAMASQSLYNAIRNNTSETQDVASERSIIGVTHIGKSGPSTVQPVPVSSLKSNLQSENLTNQTLSTSTNLAEQPHATQKKTTPVKAQVSDMLLNRGPLTKPTGSVKQGAGYPEKSVGILERSHSSTFASMSAAESATSLHEKNFKSDTVATKIQSGNTISSSTVSSSASVQPLVPSLSSAVLSSISQSSPIELATVPSSSPTISFGELNNVKPSKDVNQTVALQFSAPPTLPSSSSSSQASKMVIFPSAPESKPPIGELMSKSEILGTSQASLPHTDHPASECSLKLEPPMQPKPATEVSTGLVSGVQPNFKNIFRSASIVASSTKFEQPSIANVPVAAPFSSFSSTTDGKSESMDNVSQEDDMEEEAPDTTELNLGSLGGFGIGSAPTSAAPKANPFGAPFANATANAASSSFTFTVPTGELFRPASFDFQSVQPSQPSQPTNLSTYSCAFSTGPTSPAPTGGGFGQPAAIGPGQQALGSVLGSFGQSRQFGSGLPGTGFASPSAFGGGGFSATANPGGFGSSGSFLSTPTGGASNAAIGGGFAGAAASGGGGFAGAASAGGGFAAVASSGGGFSAAPVAGSGFGGFSAFANGGPGTGTPPAQLITQMRK
ncbi:PREDICTED: nuclear pore complex protein NUP214 isoform X2 [Nelumbo nucifera]|uniref:Nuclear pore complex protein NUP214 isoform X2 n=1 Tax=Nelumbo nucifera TaxID=4432 RepID=A0A1U8Q8C9_NELNU|nr:PREDICTED: nuclear pore complex protein NUP214 isoform X2 [Nelumbo nucifera]